jgi:hypothetical protein
MRLYSDSERAQSQSRSGEKVYRRAMKCARFSGLENHILDYVFEYSWLMPFDHGARKAVPVTIDLDALSVSSGYARHKLREGIRALARGNVLVEVEPGRWRLNPRWREWSHASGRTRILPTCHNHILNGWPLPHDCNNPIIQTEDVSQVEAPQGAPISVRDGVGGAPIPEPGAPKSERGTGELTQPLAAHATPISVRVAPIPEPGAPIPVRVAPPAHTLRIARAPGEESIPLPASEENFHSKRNEDSESEYIYKYCTPSPRAINGEACVFSTASMDAGSHPNTNSECNSHIYIQREDLSPPSGESPQLSQDATAAPDSVIPPSGDHEPQGAPVTAISEASDRATQVADVLSRADGSYPGPITPDPDVILRARKLASIQYPLNDNIQGGIYKYRFMYNSEWIMKALKRAILRGIHNSAYIAKILAGWAARGGPDPGRLAAGQGSGAGATAGARGRARGFPRRGWLALEGRYGKGLSGDLRPEQRHQSNAAPGQEREPAEACPAPVVR